MQSILNRNIQKKPKNIFNPKNPKISYIQKSFVISQKYLFVLKISKRIFLPGEEEQQQGQGQEEELS